MRDIYVNGPKQSVQDRVNAAIRDGDIPRRSRVIFRWDGDGAPMGYRRVGTVYEKKGVGHAIVVPE